MRTSLQPEYVTGFIEGAGSFTSNRSANRIAPVFAVRMKTSSRMLLKQLRSFFGNAGKIYETREKNACLFRINRTRELLRVVEHFDKHSLRGDKRNAFRIWREMVFLRATHHGRGTADGMAGLAGQLSRQTPGNKKTSNN
jgi:hypothetical protein